MSGPFVRTPYSCDICSKKYTSVKSLRKHSLRHSDIKPFKCKLCKASFRFNDFLKTHMVTHAKPKIFKCLKCNFIFNSKDDLIEHNNTVCQLLVCEICSFRCILESDMIKHKHSHLDRMDVEYSCDKCQATFSTKSTYRKHLKTHNDVLELEVFSCGICEFASTSKPHTKSHILTHCTEKSFKCEVCDFRATRKQYIQKHMQKHTQQKSYKCPDCDVRCTRKDNLKSHSAKHKKTLVYRCVSCTYETYSTIEAQEHAVIYHEDFPAFECHETIYKPHICKDCNFRAARRGELLTHMRVHETVKRFHCPHCPYQSSWTVGLKRHMLRHVKEEVF